MAEFPALPQKSGRGCGYVYFIIADENVVRPMVKIGFTKNHPEQRLGDCQLGSPVKLRVGAILAGRMFLERDIHKRFAHLRSHREWFYFEDDLRAFVEELDA